MKPGRIETTVAVVFIGLTLGWMFMGVHQQNPSFADMNAAFGLAGGASLGAILGSVREYKGRKKK